MTNGEIYQSKIILQNSEHLPEKSRGIAQEQYTESGGRCTITQQVSKTLLHTEIEKMKMEGECKKDQLNEYSSMLTTLKG